MRKCHGKAPAFLLANKAEHFADIFGNETVLGVATAVKSTLGANNKNTIQEAPWTDLMSGGEASVDPAADVHSEALHPGDVRILRRHQHQPF